MRSFFTLFAFAAAATAATSQLSAREDAQACAMKTLLSSSACNTGDAACLCSDAARKSVMEEIKAACGAEQSESTDNMATEACRTQKVRRATMPSATVVHNSLATPGSDRVDGTQKGSQDQECTCANTGSSKTQSNTPAVAAEDPQAQETSEQDPKSEEETHGSNTPSVTTPEGVDAQSQSSRVHAAGMMAATPAASSSAARHGAQVTPSASGISIPTPSAADPFSTFTGAGAQVIPSMAGVLAGLVGVLAAL